jgi:hypothetical protein
MSQASDGAALLLKLHELRMEEKLRRARAWFAFEFHPRSVKDIADAWLGPGHESAPYRMTTTYWDMAASLVVQGAIDAPMFNAANTEHFVLYAKLRPFIAELRARTGYPDYLDNVERVVMSAPDVEQKLETFGRYMQRQAGLAAEGRQAKNLE